MYEKRVKMISKTTKSNHDTINKMKNDAFSISTTGKSVGNSDFQILSTNHRQGRELPKLVGGAF